MENITHSLVGAAIAEIALPPAASVAQRRLFYIAGVVAANFPDADLVYTSITPPPIGYLLHHRGHTHTVVGCALLAAGFWLLAKAIPAVRRTVAEAPARFWSLIGVALLSHLVLDSWNSYGVHPFWPLDNRWYYGDSINILEPWLWLFLGVAAVMNTRNRYGRVVVAGAIIALPLALAAFRMMPPGALVAPSAGGAALVALLFRREPRTRSIVAAGATIAFVAANFGLNRVARAVSLESLRGVQKGEIVDLVLSPNAATPFCWRSLSIELNEAGGEYVVRNGAVSLFAGWIPLLACEGAGARDGAVLGSTRSVAVWSTSYPQSLERLRRLAREDCWVRAWLQFGRAPGVSDANIVDLRFGSGGGGFTQMPLRPPADARVCPPNLTPWSMPRADLLSLEN